MIILLVYLWPINLVNSKGNTSRALVACFCSYDDFITLVMTNDHVQEGGDPNIEGRDGSVPLMVCLVPLINKDPLHHFSHLMKVS